MTEVNHHTFRTKTGICTITPEEIILTRQGVRGEAAESLMGSGSIGGRLILFAFFGASLLAVGGFYLSREKYGDAVVPTALGAFMLVNAIRSRNNTAVPLIPRSQIQSITAKRPMPPATRGYFEVQFLQGTTSVKRLIILPGVLEGGQAEFEKALEAFRVSGLIVT